MVGRLARRLACSNSPGTVSMCVRALIVAGGELTLSDRVRAAASAADVVIAADSGLRGASALGRKVDVLIGDLDSLTDKPPDGVEIVRFPTAKDQTDLHLAIREAVRRGATRVDVLAALRGPRLDHGVANLLLLTAREFRDLDL